MGAASQGQDTPEGMGNESLKRWQYEDDMQNGSGARATETCLIPTICFYTTSVGLQSRIKFPQAAAVLSFIRSQSFYIFYIFFYFYSFYTCVLHPYKNYDSSHRAQISGSDGRDLCVYKMKPKHIQHVLTSTSSISQTTF